MQRLHSCVPEPLAALHPVHRLVEWPLRERACYRPALLDAGDQASRLERTNVLGEGDERHAMGGGEIADGAWATCEAIERLSTRGVRQRAEDRIELARLMLNHKVQCISCESVIVKLASWLLLRLRAYLHTELNGLQFDVATCTKRQPQGGEKTSI